MNTFSGYVSGNGGAENWATRGAELSVEYDAELYNAAELISKLNARGATLAANSDLRTIFLASWRAWGESMVENFDGVWALALYDKAAQKLFCSRDRFGEKTLYYTAQQAQFAFANTLQKLREFGGDFTIDNLALKKYFAYGFVPAPHTIFQRVYKLPAGNNLVYHLATGEFEYQQYWDYVIDREEKPLANLCEELIALLTNAIKKRTANVEAGVLLSGGVDSSAIVALLSPMKNSVKTFALGFTENTYDESAYAKLVAERFNCQHHLTSLANDDAVQNVVPLLQQLDEPFADDSLLPTFLLHKAARKLVDVALGGDGGDELFGGYEPLRFWQWARRFRLYLPRFMQRAIIAATSSFSSTQNYLSFGVKIKRFFRASAHKLNIWLPSLLAPLSVEEISDLLNTPTNAEEVYSEAISLWKNYAHPIDKMTQYYVKLSLPDLMLAKTTTAARLSGLNLRSPFLDKDVAELARHLPPPWRVNNGLFGGGVTKFLLKKALTNFLPAEILSRKKQGFSPPSGSWWQNGQLSFPPSANINQQFLQKIMAQHHNNINDHKLYLWAQLVLAGMQK